MSNSLPVRAMARGGALLRAGGVGMGPNLTYEPMISNHAVTDSVGRAEELAKLLNAAVPVVARQLLVAVPPSKRSDDESQFLRDCCRAETGRRVASSVTLARLMSIGARAETPHAVSEAIRAIEIGIAPLPPECVFEASEAEQLDDAALDLAQLKLRDGSPARLQQIIELGPKVIARVRRLTDAATRMLHRSPRTA